MARKKTHHSKLSFEPPTAIAGIAVVAGAGYDTVFHLSHLYLPAAVAVSQHSEAPYTHGIL